MRFVVHRPTTALVVSGLGDQSPDRGSILAWTRLKAGDESAFVEIYRAYSKRVFNHCYRRTDSFSDSEDLTAEVFARVWSRRAHIRVDEQAGGLPWLLVTANNLLSHRGESAYNRVVLPGILPEPTPMEDHAERISDRSQALDDLRTIQLVLSRLSLADRDIVQLCVIEGLTPGQVATASGEPPGTVRARLSRALSRARRHYDQLVLLPPDSLRSQ